MHWQSWGFSLGALVFIFALIPMVRQREKPPLSASIPTAAVLFVFVGLFASLGGLNTAAFTDMITAWLWTVLAVQRWLSDRRDRHARDTNDSFPVLTVNDWVRVDRHDSQSGRGIPVPEMPGVPASAREDLDF